MFLIVVTIYILHAETTYPRYKFDKLFTLGCSPKYMTWPIS